MDKEDMTFSRLYKKYSTHSARWRAIGRRLRISKNDLNVIGEDYRGNCNRCFMEVLAKWLDSGEKREESVLDRAVRESVAWYYIAIAIVAVIIAVIVAAVINFAVTAGSPIATAAQILKGEYIHPEDEFKLLDYAGDMPFLNISMRSEGSLIDSWHLFNNIDEEYHRYIQDTKLQNASYKGPRVLITGHPGAGKTTLMRQLAREWAEVGTLQSCQILFLLRLDYLQMERKPQSLKDFLELTPYNRRDIIQASEEIQDKNGAGACFLLDSYDKWSWKEDFVHSLFFGGRLNLSLCILTSRPIMKSNVRYIEIVGFDAGHLEEYLYRLAHQDNSVIEPVLKLWESNESIKEMCELPLHMVMLMYIAKYSEVPLIDLIHTRTQVYIAFMNATIQHYADDHPDWNTVVLKQCIVENNPDDELCVAFHHLAQVAFESLFNRVDKFPEYPKIVKNIKKLGFVNVTKLKSTSDQVKYKFFHPTFVEFYAAIHLLRMSDEQRFYLYHKHGEVFTHDDDSYLSNVWLFFFGLLGEHYHGDAASVSNVVRLFNLFYRDINQRAPPVRCQTCFHVVLRYIREIGWTGNDLDTLLESSGLLVNHSFYAEYLSDSFEGLTYILHHANINVLKFSGPYDMNVTLLKGEADDHIDIYDHFFNPLEECVISGGMNISPRLLNVRHYHVNLKSFPSDDIVDLQQLAGIDCLVRAAAKLHTLHIGIHSMDVQRVLTSVKKYAHNLQTLGLDIDSHCNELPAIVIKINELSSNIILELKIDVTQCNICEYCPTVPLDVLKNLNTVEKLSLKVGTALSNQEIVTLSALTELKRLSLFSDGESNLQLEEMSTLKTLDTLCVQDFKFGSTLLTTSLPPTLLELELNNDNISDEDILVLVESLRSMDKLTSLSLSFNNITGVGLRSLIDALKYHKNFTKLDLSWNPVGVDGVTGIKLLAELTNLRELQLSNCSIGEREMEVLVDALESNSNLRYLNLSHNPFIANAVGLKQLARLTSVRYLDISGCSLYRDCAHREVDVDSEEYDYGPTFYYVQGRIRGGTLCYVLKYLTQLRYLNLCNSNTERLIHWSEELASTISKLPNLHLLNAPCLFVDN